MEKTTSKQNNIHSTVTELKKKLGLDKIPVIHPPIKIKKDGKHLYKVAGYFYPLRWETLERFKIPNQRILYEVDREEWNNEMRKARENEQQTQTNEDDWLD